MPPSSSSTWEDAARRHLDSVEKNLTFADWLKGTERTDPTTIGWAITVLFYAAVHAVRAYLAARHEVVVTAHIDMRQHVATYPELRRTKADYEQLKQQSESARYYGDECFTWQDFDKLKQTAVRIRSTWKPSAEQALRARTGPATRS
jgi:hypothetical protein